MYARYGSEGNKYSTDVDDKIDADQDEIDGPTSKRAWCGSGADVS